MADTLKLVTLGYGGRPVEVRNFSDDVNFAKERDTFKINAPQRKPITASPERRYAGSFTIGETHDNGSISWTQIISGTSSDITLQKLDDWMQDLENPQPGQYILFQADGATYATLFEIRGPAQVDPNYEWVKFQSASHSLSVGVTIPVAPLSRMPQMDVLDDFTVDTIAGDPQYTWDAGVAGDVTVAGGVVSPAGTLTTERRLAHTARGYAVKGGTGQVGGTVGTTVTGFKLGAMFRRSAADTYLEAYVDDNGTNSRMRVDKVIGGTRTNLTSANLGSRLTAGQQVWVRVVARGRRVSIHFSTAKMTLAAEPATLSSYVMSGTEDGLLPAGGGGFSWIPQHATATITDFEWLPFSYSYSHTTFPATVPLEGTIPGSAPALANFDLYFDGTGTPPTFTHLTWSKNPGPWNRAVNGDAEVDAANWAVTAVTGVVGAATSVTRDTTAARAKYGSASLQVVTPATSGVGAWTKLAGVFRQGVPYTAVIYASAASSTTSMLATLGVNGNTADSGAAALTTTPTAYTVTWVPSSTAVGALLAFKTNAATATTFNIDGVTVYEGDTAPSITTQTEGRSGIPPFGVISGETAKTVSTWAAVSSASFYGDQGGANGLRATAAGAVTATADYVIDPSLLAPDDFTEFGLNLEVWARVELASTLVAPRMTASIAPFDGSNFGADRYTAEFGSTGKLLTVPSSGTQMRFVRLGVVPAVCNPSDPARYILRIKGTAEGGSTGSFGLDYLWVAPAANRTSSPTDEPLDAYYPKAFYGSTATRRLYRYDGAGFIAAPLGSLYPDTGLSSMIELPAREIAAGNIAVGAKFSSLAPGDPTSDSTTEVTSHAVGVHVNVIPRSYLLRGS